MSNEDETTRLMSSDEMDYLLETAGINALEEIISQNDSTGINLDTNETAQDSSYDSIRRSPSILSVAKSVEGEHGRRKLL